MGRTGTLHACEQEGVVPDLMTIAKGLGGGYQPIGAVLAQRRIVDAMSHGSGFFQHGHTYLGHPVACAAALAVQRVIARDGLLARVRALGASLERKLAERFRDHPHVGDVRGRGLFRGVELVRDRASKTPFDPPARPTRASSARDGARPDDLPDGRHDRRRARRPRRARAAVHREESHLDEIVDKLEAAIDAAVASA
jgi:adenosylmethionine-8-amino-7-oxononanoate aminotransferase